MKNEKFNVRYVCSVTWLLKHMFAPSKFDLGIWHFINEPTHWLMFMIQTQKICSLISVLIYYWYVRIICKLTMITFKVVKCLGISFQKFKHFLVVHWKSLPWIISLGLHLPVFDNTGCNQTHYFLFRGETVTEIALHILFCCTLLLTHPSHD